MTHEVKAELRVASVVVQVAVGVDHEQVALLVLEYGHRVAARRRGDRDALLGRGDRGVVPCARGCVSLKFLSSSCGISTLESAR